VSPPFRVHPRAVADVEEIARYYVDVEPRIDLLDRFLVKVDAAFALIAEHPLLWRVVEPPNVRRAVLESPFNEYVVYYRATSRGTTVLRVLHGRRHPRSWKGPR
jgi:plasmid stabilization system protein ParE